MRGTTWAIVPVKSLARAKRRLSPHLSASARRRLVLTMLEDVLAVLVASRGVDRVLVVSPDARVGELAADRGAMVLHEDRLEGLNAAVRKGLAHALARGAARALVLPADVPLATADEIGRVLDRGAGHRVRLVSSADGEGTNALLLAPPDAIAPGFGKGSFARHLARAEAGGCLTRVLRLPGIARDIDRPSDLARLLAERYRAERYGFLGVARKAGEAETAPVAQVRDQ
jgi:2-phospho-L-lactate guanylyltransferase